MNKNERQQYGRDHYRANKALYIQRAADRSARVRAEQSAWINDLKERVACSDCRGFFPAVAMDFDHLDDKIKSVALMVNSAGSWRRLFTEILKCEIVCSNCHRVRTAARLKA